MSKKIYLASIISITFCFVGYSQSYNNGKVTYSVINNLKKISKIEKDKNIPQEAKEKLLKIKNEASSLKYVLVFSGAESYFAKEKKIEQKKSFTEVLSGKGSYYTNLKNRKVFHSVDSFGENFIINTPFRKWKLTQESKMIGKHKCYKAITVKEVHTRSGIVKKNIIAWYTTSISVNFGLKDFSGLPGLIIELIDENVLFRATKIELNLKNKIKIKKPISGKKVSIKEYNKIVKKMFYEFRKNRGRGEN